MAGADYFLRAVELYDSKKQREADRAYRAGRDAESDRRFDASQAESNRRFNVTREDQARAREQSQANFERRDARQQSLFDSRQALAQLIGETGDAPDDVNFTPQAAELFNPSSPGTTLVPDDNGDFDVVEVYEDGSAQPHVTEKGAPVKVPRTLARSAARVQNRMKSDVGAEFLANNGGLSVNQETGLMEFNPEQMPPAPTPSPAPQRSFTGRPDSSMGSVPTPGEQQRAATTNVPGDERQGIPQVLGSAQAESLERMAERDTPAPVAPESVASVVTAKDAKSPEALAAVAASPNLVPTRNDTARVETVRAQDGVGTYPLSQRRKIAALSIKAGAMNPQQALNFINTGDMNHSPQDVKNAGFKSQKAFVDYQTSLLKYKKELGEAKTTGDGRLDSGDLGKIRSATTGMLSKLYSSTDKRGKVYKDDKLAQEASNELLAILGDPSMGSNAMSVITNPGSGLAIQNYGSAYKALRGKGVKQPGTIAFRISSDPKLAKLPPEEMDNFLKQVVINIEQSQKK